MISINSKNIDSSNVILGDLGLLSSYLISQQQEKIYDIGICPHFADADNEIFQRILNENPNSKILDTSKQPIEFMHDLSKCKTIISTGLHPLIAADSLGIPNLWCRISEKTTSKYKFFDYYSNYFIIPRQYNLYEEKIFYIKIIQEYQIKQYEVENTKNKLYNFYKNYFNTLSNQKCL